MGRQARTKLGFGLGLSRFAAAKKSTYDKRAVKAKAAALNAKKVNKYRKLLKKLDGERVADAALQRQRKAAKPATVLEDTDTAPQQGSRRSVHQPAPNAATAKHVKHGEKHGKKGGWKKPQSQLQRLAVEVALKKKREAKETREAEDKKLEEKQAKLEKQKHRRKLKAKLFKRTKTGQPVMKHRVEKILSQLQP